jgi:hypothetical protein
MVEHMQFVLDVSVKLALIAQLVAVLMGVNSPEVGHSRKLSWFLIYLCAQFLRSSIGVGLCNLGIQTSAFYNYSGIITQTAFMLFGYYSLSEKRHRKLVYISYILSTGVLIFKGILENYLEISHLAQVRHIYEIFVSLIILNERAHHHERRPFSKDSWAIIAFTILATLAFSLFTKMAEYTFVLLLKYSLYDLLFATLNCLSVITCYSIISYQLWKLKRSF